MCLRKSPQDGVGPGPRGSRGTWAREMEDERDWDARRCWDGWEDKAGRTAGPSEDPGI